MRRPGAAPTSLREFGLWLAVYSAIAILLLSGIPNFAAGPLALGRPAASTGTSGAPAPDGTTVVAPPPATVLSAAQRHALTSSPAQILPLADPNATSLDLANDTLLPGIYDPPLGITDAAATAGPDTVYVLAVNPLDLPGPDGSVLFGVNPTSGLVERAWNEPGCPSDVQASAQGIAYDALDGTVYVGCSNGTLAFVDGSTGVSLGTLVLAGVGTGARCAGFEPDVVAVTALPSLEQMAALVVSCTNTAAGYDYPLTLTVDVLNATTNALELDVPLGPTIYGAGQFESDAPLAFDPASGQLYVSSNRSVSSPEGQSVAVVDTGVGVVVRTVIVPLLSLGGPSLAYLASVQSVVAAGLPDVGTSAAEVDAILPATNTTRTLFSVGGVSPTGEQLARPLAVTAGPGSALTVTAAFPTGPEGLLVYNVTTGKMEANVSAAIAAAGTRDPFTGTVYVPDEADGLLLRIGGTPPTSLGTVVLQSSPAEAAWSGASGDLYVATEPTCDLNFFASACSNGTLAVVGGATTRLSREWSTGPGAPVGLAVAPTSGDLLVESVCPSQAYPAGCAPGGGDYHLAEYSPRGALLKTFDLPGVGVGDLPDGLAVDTRTGTIATFVAGNPKSLPLVFVNGSTGATTEIPLSGHESITGSVVYDARANVFVALSTCSGVHAPVVVCAWGLNATTGSQEWNLSRPSTYIAALAAEFGEDLAIDSRTGAVLFANGSAILEIDPSTGVDLGGFELNDPVRVLTYTSESNRLDAVVENPTADTYRLVQYNATSGALLQSDPAGEIDAAYLAVSPTNGTVAVSSASADALLFVRGAGPSTYPVSFPESGLVGPVEFNVTVGGAAEVGPGNATFSLPNGTYPYTVGEVPGFTETALPRTGTVVVDGGPVTEETAEFAPRTYAVTFAAAGTGMAGGINVSLVRERGGATEPTCPACLNTTLERTYALGNGTYHYLVRASEPGFRVTGIPVTGPLVVQGGPISVNVDLVAGGTTELNFRARGATPRVPWCVTLQQAARACTDGSGVSFTDLTPGSYGYVVSAPAGQELRHPSGTVRTTGGAKTVGVRFSAEAYSVTFAAPGLVTKSRWSVTIDGRSHATRLPLLALSLTSGTYAYDVRTSAGYVGGGSGSVVVAAANLTVAVGITAVRYPVTFTETGLAPGTNWSLTLNGVTRTVTGPTLVLELHNGTYRYLPGAVLDYYVTSKTERLRVRGAPETVAILYTSAAEASQGLPGQTALALTPATRGRAYPAGGARATVRLG